MEDYRSEVGGRLLRLRESRNMTQEDAAHVVGVAVKTWHNWESGKRSPYESNWRKISEAFEVDVAAIRGKPPAPLGLDSPDLLEAAQLDVIDAKLDQIAGTLSDLVERLVAAGVLAAVDQDNATAPPAGRAARRTRAA